MHQKGGREPGSIRNFFGCRSSQTDFKTAVAMLYHSEIILGESELLNASRNMKVPIATSDLNDKSKRVAKS